MSALSALRRAFAASLVISAACAAPAHAVDINPDDTVVSAVAQNPTINYGGVATVCPEGTMAGATGTDLDFVDVEVAFGPPGECTRNGAAVDVACEGSARVVALNGETNVATLNLNEGFSCDYTIPFTCRLSLDGPQDPNDADSVLELLNEGNAASDSIDVEVDLTMTRTGTSFCGAPRGTAVFTALYDIQEPTAPDQMLSFDP